MGVSPSGVRISPSPQMIMKINSIIYYLIILVSTIYSNSSDRIAFISYLDGSCLVENVELNRSASGLSGSSIFNNDIVSSSDDSNCDIIFDDAATTIHLDPNTKIKITSQKFSRIIRVYSGSVFVNNAETDFKTYIQTDKNDIYVNNNSVWLEFYSDYDKIIAVNDISDVYNYSVGSKFKINPLVAYNIGFDGNIAFDESLDLIPDYAKNETHLQLKKNNRYRNNIFLNDYDLIPVYGSFTDNSIARNNGLSFEFVTGLRHMKEKGFLSFGLHPKFRYNNLFIKAKFNLFYDIEDSDSYNNFVNLNDILEKFHLRYSYSNYYNSVEVYAGEIPRVTFGHGYLVKKLSNSYEFPKINDFGIRVDFKLDNDFMNFKFVVPSIREYMRDGGIFGMHTSLFLSHKFPLTIGLGFIMDLNQQNQAKRIYNISSTGDAERSVKALEIDFNLDIVKKIDLDVSLYGEFVGIWYQKDIYYLKSEGVDPFYDDVRWRKGTWGIMAPGVAVKIDNRYEFKFAFNFNSAAFYPSYFNTNYLYNKGVYFNSENPLGFNTLGFNLVSEQINMLNEFSINGDGTEFIIPKEIYPIIVNKINVFPIYGFTSEFNFYFRNKMSYNSSIGIYKQKKQVMASETYYSFENNISIKDNLLKNVSSIDFYIANTFFLDSDDDEKFTFGTNMIFELTSGMSLKFDLSQVNYDSNLDGDKESIINIGLDYGVIF